MRFSLGAVMGHKRLGISSLAHLAMRNVGCMERNMRTSWCANFASLCQGKAFLQIQFDLDDGAHSCFWCRVFELNLGIICVCLPNLKAFVKAHPLACSRFRLPIALASRTVSQTNGPPTHFLILSSRMKMADQILWSS